MKLSDLIIDTMKNDKCNDFQLKSNMTSFILRLFEMVNAKKLGEWQETVNEGKRLLVNTQIFLMVDQFMSEDIEAFGLNDDEVPPCNNVGEALGVNVAINMDNIFDDKTRVEIGDEEDQ